MAWLCNSCSMEFDAPPTASSNGDWRCPKCNATVQLKSAAVTPPTSEPVEEPADTVFQPVLMMESIMEELTEEPIQVAEPGTETLETDPSTLPSPFLELESEAYLLVLGATPGHERYPLVRAKTTFGRRETEVVLDDPAISVCHFQIEAFGKEFFVRDLESRNGTYLNGTKVRYSQLLPGDQVTVGKTTLIFRMSDDMIDRQ
jgi:pSer/pThr/pTyr-binding forkhead associated (FHA) protein